MHRLLTFSVLLTALFITASCSSGPDTPDVEVFPVEPLQSTETPEPEATAIPVSTSTAITDSWQSLDLRYAQVLEVAYEPLENGQIRFDVTLVHDDAGEAPSFADWWQVEDLNGIVLGQRVLTHGHGTQPFTRSSTIDIPDTVDEVIIRGHDMLHGFGGQVIRLDLSTGAWEILQAYP